MLRGSSGPVHLEPQVFDVLEYLVRHRERVVPKEELLDEIWGSRFVSVGALTSRIKTLRRAVGDSGREQHTILTVSRTGYRFVAPTHDVHRASPPPPSLFGVGTMDTPLRRLPVVTRGFLGRVVELRRLHRCLVDERLVTLVGPGGTGKTRLSLELARQLPHDEAVVFVDLAPLHDDGVVGQALAGALGIEAGVVPDVVEACCSYLRGRRILLVVDNCEHVLQGAADLAARILDETNEVTLLCTSRSPLGLREELLFWLQPLPLPPDATQMTTELALENDAVALFVDRTKQVRHDFELDDRSVGPVVEFCRAVDGLPLAIELAACRMAVFDIEDLLVRLRHRLDVLRDDRSGTAERHRSLRTTLDWSYKLLDHDGQRLFDHLSVFPSGLTLDAVEWLGTRLSLQTEAAEALQLLVEASLVGRTASASGTRYVQLETMRAFGLDRLEDAGDADAARALAADWGVELVTRQELSLRSPQERRWNDRIRRELPNLRVVRKQLRSSGRIAELVDLSVHLAEWSHSRNVTELWAWIDEMEDLVELGGRTAERVAALAAQAAWSRGRLDEVDAHIRPLLDGGTDPWAVAHAYSSLATAEFFRGHLSAAIDAAEHPVGNASSAAQFIVRALARAYAGDIGGAQVHLAEMRTSAERWEWPTLRAWTDYIAGEIDWITGGPYASEHLEASISCANEAGADFIAGVAGVTLCEISIANGNTLDAAHRYRGLIEHWLRSGMWTVLWTTLRNASALTEAVDPSVTLLILDKADADPYAPEVDDPTRVLLNQRRERAASAVGEDAATALAATVAGLDRGVLAHHVRQSLLRLTEASSVD